jgi:hypothetical protein
MLGSRQISSAFTNGPSPYTPAAAPNAAPAMAYPTPAATAATMPYAPMQQPYIGAGQYAPSLNPQQAAQQNTEPAQTNYLHDAVLIGAGVAGAGLITVGVHSLLKKPEAPAPSSASPIQLTETPKTPYQLEILQKPDAGKFPIYKQLPGQGTCGYATAHTLQRHFKFNGDLAQSQKIVEADRTSHEMYSSGQLIYHPEHPEELHPSSFARLYNSMSDTQREYFQSNRYKGSEAERQAQLDEIKYIPETFDEAKSTRNGEGSFVDYASGMLVGRQILKATDLAGDENARKAHKSLSLVTGSGQLGNPGRTPQDAFYLQSDAGRLMPVNKFAVLSFQVGRASQTDPTEAEILALDKTAKSGHFVSIVHEGKDNEAGWYAIDSSPGTKVQLHREAAPSVGGAWQALQAYLGDKGKRLEELGVTENGDFRAHVAVLIPNLSKLVSVDKNPFHTPRI